jgi:hypothetical protein
MRRRSGKVSLQTQTPTVSKTKGALTANTKYQVLEGMEQKYLVMMVCRLKGVSSDDGM